MKRREAKKLARELVNKYSQGASIQQLCAELNESGVKTGRGLSWSYERMAAFVVGTGLRFKGSRAKAGLVQPLAASKFVSPVRSIRQGEDQQFTQLGQVVLASNISTPNKINFLNILVERFR